MYHAFHPFTVEHYTTLLIGFGVLGVLIVMGRYGGSPRQVASCLLTFCCLSAYPLSQAAWLSFDIDQSLDNQLPLHLCDVAAFIAGFAMITRKPLLCTLTYFWGLAATVQALLTPAIPVGFPAWPYITFFIQHFAIVGVALYLPIVQSWRPLTPWWKSPLIAYGWILIYLLTVMIINRVLHSNFGFAMHPPENPSLIDHLGPWPWYLVSMSGIALVLFLVLALPFSRSSARSK